MTEPKKKKKGILSSTNLRLQQPFIVVTAIGTLIMILLTSWIMASTLQRMLTEKACYSAVALANELNAKSMTRTPKDLKAMLDDTIKVHADPDLVFAALCTSSGRVITSTDADVTRSFPPLSSAERQSVDGNAGVLIAASREIRGIGNIGALAKLDQQRSPDTYLRIGYSDARIWMLILVVDIIAVIGAVGIFVARSAIYVKTAKRFLTGPMSLVANQANAIARGDLASSILHEHTDASLAALKKIIVYREINSLLTSMREMTTYLTEVAGLADAVAAGDLRVQIAPRSESDSFGKALQKMVQQLSKIVREISDASINLGSLADQLNTTSHQQSANIAEQAASVQQSLVILEQMKSSVSKATEKATSVVSLSEQSVEVSGAGYTAIQDSTTAILKLDQKVSDISRNIAELIAKVELIGEITSSVNDIAEQSKLLSVNAAIEAIKAGESGRGFSVVAAEVKNMAIQSKQATEQVQTIIREIQIAASSTQSVTTEGAMLAENGVKQLEKIRTNFNLLSHVIGESQSAAKQIAAMTYQQAAGIEQVSRGVDQISQAASRSVTSSEEQQAATQVLTALADDIADLVSHYKLNGR